MKQIAVLAAAVFVLSACATVPAPAPQQDAFLANLNALCGQRFLGRVVTTDAADAGEEHMSSMVRAGPTSHRARNPQKLASSRARSSP